MEAAAERAARVAVKDTLFLVGIDVEDRDALDAWQSDRAFVRRRRLQAEARGMSLSTGIVAVLLSAISTVGGAWLLGILHIGGR